MTEKTLQKIDIFISSPGDLGEERKIASEVIEQLNSMSHIADRFMLKPLAYEKEVPAAIGETPQRTVDRYMMEADQCDLFICILWSRMGTPVIDETGKEYQSGTEYEFIRAYQANQKNGTPYILLYRNKRSVSIDDADLKQIELVKAFFKRFEGKEAEFKGLYKKYQTNDEFRKTLFQDIDKIISSNLIKSRTVGSAGIAAERDVNIGDISGQVAIGNFINQFKIEKPSGEELFKLITLLDQKRKEESNKEIFGNYNPSEIPDYPPQLKEFVTFNRADDITKAITYLQDHRILLISGIGGVGKTTLARALIETRPANVPLPFWFDFGKKTDAMLGDVLEKLAGYLKASGIAVFRAEKRDAGQDDINRLTGELQRQEQVWLIFDNLEIIVNEDRKFHDEGLDLLFTSLCGSTHKAKIIVTSRILPLLNNGESLIDALDEKQELKGLKLNSAIDYLVKNGLEGVENKKLEELATGVDGHPLALRLLIELVKKFGVSDTLKDLGMFQKRKEDTIKKARRLFEKLAGDEKKLLENISVFRKPETMTAIKAMFTERTSEDAIEKLMDKSLLETNLKGDYWLHPLIREFSYGDLNKKKEIHQLAFSYYISLKLPEKPTRKDDLQSLLEAHYHACMAKDYDQAASIIFDKNLYEDLDRWGEYRTLVDLYIRMLPKDIEERLLNNKQTHGVVLGNIGNAYSQLGQVEKAIEYYQKALAIAREIGDRKNEGNCLANLGLVYRHLGQIEKAIEHDQKALAIAQEIGDRRNEENCLGNLGISYYFLGQIEKAIEYYQKALAIAREIGDRRGEGNWLVNLGLAYGHLGQVEKAIEHYQKALEITQEIGDRRGEGNCLANLGITYSKPSQVEKAIEYHQKALEIAQEIRDKRREGNCLANLGITYSQLGQIAKAIEYYQKALAIGKEIKDPRIINFCEKQLATIRS